MKPARPRILCLVETVGRGGGAEQLVADLAPRLRARGLDLEVAALFDWPDDLGTDIAAAGVPLHRLSIPAGVRVDVGVPRLRALLRRRRYDVFWSHLPWDHVYARVARALTRGSVSVNTFHAEGFVAAGAGWKARVEARLQRLACAGSVARVAVSRAVAADYARAFGWRDMPVAYNGVPVDAILAHGGSEDRAVVRARHGVAADVFLIVVPARYVPKKGQPVLIEAARRLRARGIAPRIMMFGVGPTEAALRAEVAAAGLAAQITVGPVLAHAQLFPLIRAADLVVQPSLREPFGIAALEALALGTPAVLSDVDGFRETTDGGRLARLVPAGDAGALAEAIAAVHADPAAERARAAAALPHIRAQFGIDACADRWHDILLAAHQRREGG